MISHVKKLIFFILLPATAGFIFLNTGLEYLPVEISIGKCFMDYRQPTAYQHRAATLRQVDLKLENGEAILCYSSPQEAELSVIGSQIRFGEVWQMGMYEPTRLYTNTDLLLGDLLIPKGRYSIYAIPQRSEWEIIISSSITHRGSDITTSVRSEEVGSTQIRREFIRQSSEKLHFTSMDGSLIMDWGQTRLRIPLRSVE